MDPTDDTLIIPSDAGPHTQTITLPDEGVAPAGGLELKLTYDDAVISVDGVANGETVTIAEGDPSVTVNVSAVAPGTTDLFAWSPDVSGRASYVVRYRAMSTNPTEDSFVIPDVPGPNSQTISLLEGAVAPAGGMDVTFDYDWAVISVFSDSEATNFVAPGESVTIPEGESEVTVYVSGYSSGSTTLVASAEEMASASADYETTVIPVPGPEGIVLDGLVIAYRAGDADCAGHPGNDERLDLKHWESPWTDLARGDEVNNIGKLRDFTHEPGSGWTENLDQDENSPYRFALEFLGTTHTDGDYVHVSPTSFMDQDNFTYEFWIKTDTSTWLKSRSNLISECNNGPGMEVNELKVYADGGVRIYESSDGGGGGLQVAPAGFMPIGEFHQLVMTKSGNDVWVYVNGGDDEGEACYGEMTDKWSGTAPNEQWIGARDNGNRRYCPFSGQMSIIRIYNRALTPEEVAGNYYAEFAPRLVMSPETDSFSPSDPGPHTQTITLPEGGIAVGDVLVTLTYDEAVITVDGIASGETVTIADGTSEVVVNVTGVGIGSTQLKAEADDYSPGTASYSVTGEIALSMARSDDPGTPIDPATTPLVLGDDYILTVTVDPAAPDGGMTLTIEYDDMFMTIEDPAFIDAGNSSVALAVTADVATVEAGVWGPPVTVTVSGTADYTPASADYAIGFQPGDATDDNCVNVQDLLTVRGQLGKEGSEIDPLSADIDGDGKVNVLDLLAVRGALGKGHGCP